MSSTVLPRLGSVLLGVGALSAATFGAWVAGSRNNIRSEDLRAAKGPSSRNDGAQVAQVPSPANEQGNGHRRSDPVDPLGQLFGTAVKVADQAAKAVAKSPDEKTLEKMIEVAADGALTGLDVIDSNLPPLDPKVAKELGDTLRESLLREHGRVTDKRILMLVTPTWEEVIRALKKDAAGITFTITGDPEVNAYAFVGRNVLVTRGFVDFVAGCSQPKESLRFALAHELGHIVYGHTDKPFRRLVAADKIVPGAGLAATTIELILKQTPINQAAEKEADCFARRIHIDNGWSLDGAKELFQRIKQLTGRADAGLTMDRLLGSHPDEGQRLELIESGEGCGK